MDTSVSYPLALRQRRLVRLGAPGPGPALWLLLRLRPAPVDETALTRALRTTAERHEILRTRLAEAAGLTLPVQEVAPEADLTLEVADVVLDVTDGTDDDALVRRAVEEASRRAAAPPAALLLRGADRAGRTAPTGRGADALVLTASTLHNDPAGMLRWAEEISAAYAAALADGAATPLPPVELQLAQIGEWHNELLTDPDEEEAREVWRRRDPGVLAELPVPLGRPAPLRPPAAELGAEQAVSSRRPALSAEETARALATVGASAEALLLAAWRVTVARLTGDPGGRTGVWTAGRQLPVLAESLGPVGRYLPIGGVGGGGDERPVLANLDGTDRFADAVTATAAALDRAIEAAEQFVPGDLPGTAEAPSRPDRFAVAFRHVDLGTGWRGGAAAFEPVALGGALEPVGVELTVEQTSTGCVASLGFDPRRIDPEAAERLLDAYLVLLRAAVDAPETELAALPLLDAAGEQRELTASRARPLAAETADRIATFPARLAAAIERTPDAPALIDGDTEVDFAELGVRSGRLARRLLDHGVGPEVPVGLVGHRDAATLIGLVAILRAGGTLLPLDPAHPEARLAAILQEASPVLVLDAQDSTADREATAPAVARAAAQAGVPRHTLGDLDTPELEPEDAPGHPPDGDAPPLPDPDPEHSAYLLYTSGSTGRPKGTRVSHRGLVHLADALEAAVLGPLEEDLAAPLARVALNAPLVFDASVKQWLQLARGRALVTVPDAVRLDARRFLEELAARRVDLLDATPSHLAVLLDAGLAEATRPTAVLVGGEAIGAGLWNRLAADRRRAYVNVYGPTECTVDAAAARVAGEVPSFGTALPGTSLHLLDPLGRLVPHGAPGELHVGGPGVSRGYHDRPGATAARFLPDPFAGDGAPGARRFATGDLARRLPDGRLEFLGRRDRQVKLRGLRLELGEIEAALASHPEVRDVAVDTDGERLLAWAAVGEGVTERAAELRETLREHLRRLLPEYMVPSGLGLLAELPRTSRGKVDRTALADRGAHQGPERGPRLAPRNELESALAEIWSRVLEVDEVGVDENFFDLGGHSLLMVRLYDEVRQRFDTELPMLELFRRPTVAALATRLQADLDGTAEESTAVDPDRIRDRARRQSAAAAAARRRQSARRGEEAR